MPENDTNPTVPQDTTQPEPETPPVVPPDPEVVPQVIIER